MYTGKTMISEVISDPCFQDFGHLLFPVQKEFMSGERLDELAIYWYNFISPLTTVKILNDLKQRSEDGETVFFPIYSPEDIKQDQRKADIGLFFFKGIRNGKTAVVCPGGGFRFVGAMQDAFPHCLFLSEQGINSFALIYRPNDGNGDLAAHDLARAIAFLHEHAGELGIDMKEYSIWGGSAGGRMAAWLGGRGTEAFGEKKCPGPAAVITQYSGNTEVEDAEPPTYACIGNGDEIVDHHVMEKRIETLKEHGTEARIEVFDGLPHGFGMGEGTTAEGWAQRALEFWKQQMK